MLHTDIDAMLNSKDKLLTEIYFDLQRYFEEKYGDDTVVFMEIGTFFEVYEVNNDELQVGKAKEMAELLNIQLTKKNKNIPENSVKNPFLAGDVSNHCRRTQTAPEPGGPDHGPAG